MTFRIKLATAAATALAMFCQTAQAVPIQWEISDGGNGHWYEFIHAQGINWFQADAAASSASHLGATGHLVTLTSAEENAFAFSIVNVRGSIWLGGFQPGGTEPADGWTWVTGEAFAFTNWAGIEPNDAGGEDHLTFDDFTDRNGTWNDWSGTNGATGYVIEYAVAVPEPSILALFGAALLGFGLRRKRA